MSSRLQGFGYAVDVVADGTQAITNASSRDYDVIILDLMFKDFYNGNNNDCHDGPLARFSLVKSYADLMNLKLNASIENDNRFRIRVSNIKIV